jgi:hypothetical protein
MSLRFGRAVRGATVLLALPAAVAAMAAPTGACGGLVGENGTIQLEKTSTLAAYHDGVERYVTSFEFSGTGEEVGSITPLPGIPTDVKRGGDWTLQRLQREVAPPARESALAAADQASGLAKGAEVLLETKVDALDITILKGGGSEVGEWAVDHGFFLTPDAPEMLDFYSRRSPIFMAARFDAKRAATLGQSAGDGTPIMLTIPTKEPWVPLRILSLGLDNSEVVEADVFLLTDEQPKLLAGGPGLSLDRNEQASSLLLDDLRSDKGMEWVPASMWFTYLSVNAAAGDLDYDLAMATKPGAVPDIAATGVNASEARTITPPSEWDSMPLVIAGLVGIAVFAAFSIGGRRRRPDVGAAA